MADAEKEIYYIAVNTGDAVFDRSGSQVSAAPGDEYTATFRVDDTKPVGPDAEDHQSVNSTSEIITGTTSLDETPVNVTASPDQTITGTSKLGRARSSP